MRTRRLVRMGEVEVKRGEQSGEGSRACGFARTQSEVRIGAK